MMRTHKSISEVSGMHSKSRAVYIDGLCIRPISIGVSSFELDNSREHDLLVDQSAQGCPEIRVFVPFFRYHDRK